MELANKIWNNFVTKTFVGNLMLHAALDEVKYDALDIGEKRCTKVSEDAHICLKEPVDKIEKSYQSVKSLIAYGVNVNAKDIIGKTALHKAPDTKTAKLLIEAGASINAVDYSGKTVLEDLVRLDNSKLFEYAINNNANIGGKVGANIYLSAARLGNVNMMKIMEEKSPEIKANTAIMSEALREVVQTSGELNDHYRHTTIEHLLNKGAEVNAQDSNNGKTSLHLLLETALYEDSALNGCKILRENGADLNIMDNNGNTPIDLFPGDIAIIKDCISLS